MDVLEEQLQIILGSWRQAPFSFSGAHYRIDDLDAQPKPAQVPHPPLIIGGNAAPRSAALAARYADEYNTPFPAQAEVVRRRAVIHEACERVGRDPIPFSVMTCVVVGSDEAELRERVARVAELHRNHPSDMLSNPPPGWILGTVEQVAERCAALREAGVSRLMCQHLAHDDLDMVALLGRELAPALAGD
jgi:alkanesulfonate monooxygenase SsuD/methylene tetrahydromethanopterin reductase-like flavin-dependent oxidoreductase (luciferase family)